MSLKLYVISPNGNGQNTFYVTAKSKKGAFNKVDALYRKITGLTKYFERNTDSCSSKIPPEIPYEWHGWGTDYYNEPEPHNINEILINNNC